MGERFYASNNQQTKVAKQMEFWEEASPNNEALNGGRDKLRPETVNKECKDLGRLPNDAHKSKWAELVEMDSHKRTKTTRLCWWLEDSNLPRYNQVRGKADFSIEGILGIVSEDDRKSEAIFHQL